jgi:hypothetical protein
MPDYYPQEKGSIRRDRVGEFRDLMAKEQLGMMPIGGMAAKMSSPATDVLSRWIRRFRKDKPPTVPLKNIEKALHHEGLRRGLGPPPRSWEPSKVDRLRRDPSIQQRRFESSPRSLGHTYLGFKEKPEFDRLHDFISFLKDRYKGWYDPR